jgi:acetyl-CoA acyltransferase
MQEAYIFEATRSAIGKKKGAFAHTRPDVLAARVLQALALKAGLDVDAIDDIIMGCVTQIGEQGMNIARIASLMAGFPKEVTGTTINRQCGSSQQAFHFAAQAVQSGAMDMVIAAGVESMTRVPMVADATMVEGINGWFPPDVMLTDRYEIIMQGPAAERVAAQYKISREALDAFSAESHQRAKLAQEKGYFTKEISHIEANQEDGSTKNITEDEGIRPDTTAEKLSTLKPAFQEDGVITAGSSSQISDGAAALLVGSLEKGDEIGLTPRAKIISTAVAGVDPTIMLTGPMPATRKALQKAKLLLSDIDLFEVNEAFASVVLAFEKELGVPHEKVNVNGGAIALGHPLGCSGARLLTTLLHEMERRDVRYGLVSMCIGFGQGTATIIDRQL